MDRALAELLITGRGHARGGSRFLVTALIVLLGVAAIGLLAQADRSERQLLMDDPDLIPDDGRLMVRVVAHGRSVFTASCARCHGVDGRGDVERGVPSLADGDWLYGSGRPAQIERTITYGIRAGRPRTWDLAAMPAFAKARPSPTLDLSPLSPGDIRDVVAFVRQLGGEAGDAEAVARGAVIFADRGGCYDCHGADGAGDAAIGAPNLTDRIWLYGDGSAQSIARVVAEGAAGMCPSQIGHLSPGDIRKVALYIYSLSGKLKK